MSGYGWFGLYQSLHKPEKPIWQSIKEIDEKVSLFDQYMPTYADIHEHPRALGMLHNHPGFKFMKKGWRIIGFIILIIYLIGRYA